MDRFTELLANGMRARGHDIRIWHPVPLFASLPAGKQVKKWLGYLDQFILFPFAVRTRMMKCKNECLYVFTDQALGPWVPLVRHKKHIIHCHDFLALQSACGLIPENVTSWSGRIYQAFIRRGFTAGKNFISVSKKTNKHLHTYINKATTRTEVVYNGLDDSYRPTDRLAAREYMIQETGLNLARGYIMHVGGNQWYKNRRGVVEIYNAWKLRTNSVLPLLLIGEGPSDDLFEEVYGSKYRNDIYFLSGRSDEFILNAYSGASLLLFPSLAEGFGWPIAEAMACGCQVVTTNQAPMTEVGANAAFYIDRRPLKSLEVPYWAHAAADLMQEIISAPESVRKMSVNAGLRNAERFNVRTALDKIEKIYLEVLEGN